jgi:carboxymethylenebutenolidase
MSTSRIEFQAEGGRSVAGDLALPGGSAPAPAVIVVQEWWGLNDDMRRVASRLADAGFVALAVDLYGGRVATVREEAMQLAMAMKTPEALEVIRGALAALRAHPRCTGKVGITGFCLGGAVALAAACNVEGIGAAVPFYGIPLPQYADYANVKAPIQGHYGEKDPVIPAEKPRAAEAAVRAAGGEAEMFLYDAGHAFMREGDPEAYHEASATLAWERALTFFKAKLG